MTSLFDALASDLFTRPAQDCIAYSYTALPPEERFPLSLFPDGDIATECQLISRPQWGWASLLNLTTPEVTQRYSHVFVLLDDVLLPHGAFNLSRLLTLMHRVDLDVVSPTLTGASRIGMSPLQETRSKPTTPLEGGCAHLVPVVEIFATLFTSAAWRCFHSLFADEVLRNATGAIGWGYDLCFKAHCGSHGIRRFGIALSQHAVHTEGPIGEIAALNQLVHRKQYIMQERNSVGAQVVQGASVKS